MTPGTDYEDALVIQQPVSIQLKGTPHDDNTRHNKTADSNNYNRLAIHRQDSRQNAFWQAGS